MLRNFVLVIGVACLAGGLLLLALGLPPAFVLLIWGVLIVCGVVFERIRYKPLRATTPGPGWQETPERFIDDETGAEVVVYVQPNTGERAYVRDGRTVPAPR
jgi:hypothetical protein